MISPSVREALRRREMTPRIAHHRVDSSARLRRFRWVMERTNTWVLAQRRLVFRFDRQVACVLAFRHRACTRICPRFLQQVGQD
jgi:hypothetical protein